MTTDGAIVFIDAENISPYHYHRIINKINEFTYIKSVKAIADWDYHTPSIKLWRKLAEKESCIEKISYPHVARKNTSDILLTIHAIEALNTPCSAFSIFALCSADSDFSPLITHMKDKGKLTIGFGGGNFSNSYNKKFDFYYDITPKSDIDLKQSKAAFRLGCEDLNSPKYLDTINLIIEAIKIYEQKGHGFVKLSDIGLFLKSEYKLKISDLGFTGSLSDFISLYPNKLNITPDYRSCRLIR